MLSSATNIDLPVKSFVIQRLKSEWNMGWGEMGIVSSKLRMDARNGSGRLVSPEKKYVLKQATNVALTVGQKKDYEVFCLQ